MGVIFQVVVLVLNMIGLSFVMIIWSKDGFLNILIKTTFFVSVVLNGLFLLAVLGYVVKVN
jgi:hypothetical protein